MSDETVEAETAAAPVDVTAMRDILAAELEPYFEGENGKLHYHLALSRFKERAALAVIDQLVARQAPALPAPPVPPTPNRAARRAKANGSTPA